MGPLDRPTAWWLDALRKRRERMRYETLDFSTAVTWESEEEKLAAIAFFNAAFRAEESGLRQAHELADEVGVWDAELGETLRLYGEEEGWHRELLTEFLDKIGGYVKPMGPTTSTFYTLYKRAERMETIVLTNLMFETIGATTYRIALRTARPQPAVQRMLTILTRDESFHVPLNAHFLRRIFQREPARAKQRSQLLYHVLTGALVASAAASRRRAFTFDRIPFSVLAGSYADALTRLFVQAPDLGLTPMPGLIPLLRLLGAQRLTEDDPLSIRAAEAAVEREKVMVE
ncbi:ferritin-like domain-containing protein [Pendulispora rubella]|uniref:Ferritin-like domain-containing protein n=1 Tax=Pendulispora rubella TaxID=2741070 RepID=A0ABZ2L778_9BACT